MRSLFLIFSLLALASAAGAARLCPDGSWVGGDECRLAPDGSYVGGVIAPGVGVSAQNLFERAARLGAVELTLPERVVGRNTDESLRAGIILGAARAADGIVEAIREERGERGAVVATGGWAAVVAPAMETGPQVDAELTLKGLALAYERRNAKR